MIEWYFYLIFSLNMVEWTACMRWNPLDDLKFLDLTIYKSSITKINFNWNNLIQQKGGWRIILDILVSSMFYMWTVMLSTFENVEFKPHIFHVLYLLDINIVWCGIWIILKSLARYFQSFSKKWNWWMLDGEIVIFTREVAPCPINSSKIEKN